MADNRPPAIHLTADQMKTIYYHLGLGRGLDGLDLQWIADDVSRAVNEQHWVDGKCVPWEKKHGA